MVLDSDLRCHTPAMRTLHRRFADLERQREWDPLLIIPLYILDFLCIHPFLDGNGRLGRLIALLLFYLHGYEVGTIREPGAGH